MSDAESPEAMKVGFLQAHFFQDFVETSPQDVGSRKRCSSRRLKHETRFALANMLAEQSWERRVPRSNDCAGREEPIPGHLAAGGRCEAGKTAFRKEDGPRNVPGSRQANLQLKVHTVNSRVKTQ